MVPSSIGRKTRITMTPEKMININDPEYKTYNDIATAMKGKEMEWIKLEDTVDVNQARNIMTTSMYALGGKGAKKKYPFGMFLKKGSFDDGNRLKLQSMDKYDININDKNNPGRLLMDKEKKNIFKYDKDKVALYINIPEGLAKDKYGDTEMKDGVEKGKGGWQWAWIDPTKDVKEQIGGEKVILFPFRERVLTDNTKKGVSEPKKKGWVKTLASKWNNMMGGTPKNARFDYYDYMEGDEWYYDDYGYDDDDDDLYYEYQQLLRQERTLDRLLRAYDHNRK